MTDPAIAVVGLTRTFRTRSAARTALADVDLDLPPGGVHGLLGPNGAGKTTLCRIASTVLTPTAGTIRVLGDDVVTDPSAVRRSIGIVFGGDRGLYGRLTARENLEFWAAMSEVPPSRTAGRVGGLLDRLGLAARADDLVETFSRGMKQRLHLARGLVDDPPVLLLDEPTVGMDPVSAHEFRRLVAELRREGRTILLTTHDMAEAEALCDTVTFIDGGRVVGSGTPATVAGMLAQGGLLVRVHAVSGADHTALLDRLPAGVQATQSGGDVSEVRLPGPDLLGAVVAAAASCGLTTITTGPPSLEAVYLDLLGRGADGDARGMAVE